MDLYEESIDIFQVRNLITYMSNIDINITSYVSLSSQQKLCDDRLTER